MSKQLLKVVLDNRISKHPIKIYTQTELRRVNEMIEQCNERDRLENGSGYYEFMGVGEALVRDDVKVIMLEPIINEIEYCIAVFNSDDEPKDTGNE